MQYRNLHGKNTASCYEYSKIIPKRIREWVTDHRLGYMIGTQQDSSPTWRNIYYCKDRAVRWCFDRKDTNRRKLLSSVVGILEAARIQRHSACGIRGRMNTPWIIASRSSYCGGFWYRGLVFHQMEWQDVAIIEMIYWRSILKVNI